jgi:hypothetical protein
MPSPVHDKSHLTICHPERSSAAKSKNLLLFFQSLDLADFKSLTTIFPKNSPKIACQVPKPLNPNKQKHIKLEI